MSQKPKDTVLRYMERSQQAESQEGTTPPITQLDMNGNVPAKVESRSKFLSARLGDIMVELGMITLAQRGKIEKTQAKSKDAFGECAVRLRIVSKAQLQQALEAQFARQVPKNGRFKFSNDAIVAHKPFGLYGDAVRAVASRLISQWLTPTQKTLAITSSSRGEGRTHVSANLAIAFAQFGKRTLLIDGDLHHPRLHNIFHVPLHPGLSRALCGLVVDDVIRAVPDVDNLNLITAGPIPPNATEVLSRDEFPSFLRHAERSFDVVLIDTPCGRHVDSEIISRTAGSALIISSPNRTRVKSLRALKEQLQSDGVIIAGILTNET